MFKPINKHIQVQPISQDSFIKSQDAVFEEKGKVLAIAEDVTKIKVGQIVFFDSWMIARYIDSSDKLIYLVSEENIRAIEE